MRFGSRDNGRTPMQWDATANAGFTKGEPWLPVNKNHITINVAADDTIPTSILNHFRTMVQVRKNNPVLVHGAYELLFPANPDIYAYTRIWENKKMLVLLNFSTKVKQVVLPDNLALEKIVINNYGDLQLKEQEISLQPYQGVIFSLKN